MLAYSTNPSIRTEFSVREEQKQKTHRIALEISNRRDFQNAKNDYVEGFISSSTLHDQLVKITKKHLHATDGQREEKLGKLISAVVLWLQKWFV